MIATTIIKQFYTFTAGSAPTSFAFDFHFGYTSEINAIVTRPDGTNVTLTEGIDYTVSSPSSSGTLTRISTWDSQATQLTIYRVTAQTNEQSIPDGTAIDGPTLEATIDEVVQMAQELDDIGTRALRVPISDTSEPGDIPTKDTRAGHFLAFDSNGDPIAGDPSSVPVSTFMQTVVAETGASAVRSDLSAAVAPDDPSSWSPSSSTTLTLTTLPRVLKVDPSTYTATVQLPLSTAVSAYPRITVKYTGTSTGTVKIQPGSGESLAGVTDGTWTITQEDGFVTLELDGTDWVVVAAKGSVFKTATAQAQQASATNATWYNLGGSLTLDPGTYRLRYQTTMYASSGTTGNIYVGATLSTANNTEGDPEFLAGAAGYNVVGALAAMSKLVTIAASTTYYLNLYYRGLGTVTLATFLSGTILGNNDAEAIIEAERIG